MWKIFKKLFARYYYTYKYPHTNIYYKRTDKFGTIDIDVRQFVNPKNSLLPTIIGNGHDDVALESLKWVIKHIKYIPDKTQYKLNEYWAYNYETMKNKKGDCEDGAILLYCIMRKNNIPEWKIRINAGDVDDGEGNKGGHAFVVYYCEKLDKWVLLDWCYWKNTNPIIIRKDYKDEDYYKTCWFSFNENFAWAKDVKDVPKIKQMKGGLK